MKRRVGWIAAGLAACIVLALLLSRNQYEMRQEENGRTIILNKWTGSVKILQGNQLIGLKGQEDLQKERLSAEATRAREDSLSAQLAEPKYWPSLKLDRLGCSAVIKTSWRGGKLVMIATITPVPKNYPRGSMTVRFHDKADFELLHQGYYFSGYAASSEVTRLIDETGKASGLSLTASISCDNKTYLAIARPAIVWTD